MTIQSLKFLSLFLFLIGFTQVSFAKIDKNLKGIQAATAEVKIPRPDIESSQPGLESFQTCYIFPKFVIVEPYSGGKGADSIWLRHLKKSDDAKKVCALKTYPKEIRLKDNDQYFLGSNENVLFTRSSDSFGHSDGIWIYDVKTGQQLFEAKYDSTQDFIVSYEKNIASLEFYQQLKLNCALQESEKVCWEKIAKDNSMAETKEIGLPDCREAYKRIDFKANPSLLKEPNAIQIFSKVRVDNVNNPTVKFLNVKATCNETP